MLWKPLRLQNIDKPSAHLRIGSERDSDQFFLVNFDRFSIAQKIGDGTNQDLHIGSNKFSVSRPQASGLICGLASRTTRSLHPRPEVHWLQCRL